MEERCGDQEEPLRRTRRYHDQTYLAISAHQRAVIRDDPENL